MSRRDDDVKKPGRGHSDDLPTVAEGPTIADSSSPPTLATAVDDGSGLDDTIGTVTAEQPGRYTIQGVHGSGGQARVMLAFDAHIGREVALKELLPERGRRESTSPWASPRSIPGVVRFLREARVTGQLEHPNIVPVYEVGRRQDGTLYYTMRLVRGQTLAQKLADCHNLQQRMHYLGVFWDMCKAIAYAHSRGVVHRDIKPSNVMVGEFEETVLLDWGIAKVQGKRDIGARDIKRELRLQSDENTEKTSAGATMGTPSYMSPEQARGEIDRIDERSDVWGLGAVLYEILTGHPPHEGRTRQEIVVRAGRQPVRPVRERCPEAPAELAAIAEKALHRDPRRRYQTARAMADDVRAYMTGEKVAAYSYSTWELIRRFAAQHKALLFSIVAVLAVLVGALVSVSLSLRAESAARQREEKALAREKSARRKERREHLQANLYLAQAYAERAAGYMADARFPRARVLATASLHHNPAHPRSPYFDREFAGSHPQAQYWRVEAASQIYRLAFHLSARLNWSLAAGDVLTRVSFSPDGRLGAVGSYDGNIYVFATGDGRQLARLPAHGMRVYDVDFSPDGKLLASAGHDNHVCLWRVEDWRRLRSLGGHGAPVRAVRFLPGGRRLVSAAEDGTWMLWDATSGRRLAANSSGLGTIYSVAVDAGGQLLALGTEKGRVLLWRPAASRPTAELALSDKAIYTTAFSPDGKLLAAAGDDRLIHLWSLANRREVEPLRGHSDGILSLSFSADGSRLASAGYDGTVRLWQVPGGRLLLNLPHEQFVFSGVLSPDGKTLASAGYDRTLRLFELLPPTHLRQFRGHRGTIYALARSPDGRLLASAGWDHDIRLWDLETGRLLAVLRGHGNVIDSVAFSPDGKLLASASRDGTVRIWDVRRRRARFQLRGHRDTAYSVAFSPDGKLLASSGMGGKVITWAVASGTKLLEIQANKGEVDNVVFSPDGRLLATVGQDRLVRLFTAATGEPLRVLAGHEDWTSSVVFSPDGRRLVSCGKDARVILWDVDSGRQVGRFVGHDQWVNTVRFSPGGKLLATASDDRTVRVWSVAERQPLLKIPASSEVVAIEFIDGGRRLALGDDAVVKIYPLDFTTLELDTGRELLEVQRRAGLRLEGFRLEAARPAGSPPCLPGDGTLSK